MLANYASIISGHNEKARMHIVHSRIFILQVTESAGISELKVEEARSQCALWATPMFFLAGWNCFLAGWSFFLAGWSLLLAG